jgi:hypothetical protein
MGDELNLISSWNAIQISAWDIVPAEGECRISRRILGSGELTGRLYTRRKQSHLSSQM